MYEQMQNELGKQVGDAERRIKNYEEEVKIFCGSESAKGFQWGTQKLWEEMNTKLDEEKEMNNQAWEEIEYKIKESFRGIEKQISENRKGNPNLT